MPPSSAPGQFQEAVRYFRQKVPMTEQEFKELLEEDHDRAFMVSGLTQANLVQTVYDALDRAVSKGTIYEDFLLDIEPVLQQWEGASPTRLDIVFRTNVQLAYGRGRWQQMTQSDVLEARPFWSFNAILDGRETPICHECNGTVLPASSSWWKSHWPPLHHRCRSRVQTLTEGQAKQRGVTEAHPKAEASEGFGGAPDSKGDMYLETPDVSELEPGLRKALEREMRRRGKL